MDTQFFWGIIAGAFIILVAFLIPTILQIKRTAKVAEDFLKNTHSTLNPLLIQLKETVEMTNQVAEKLDESISSVRNLTNAVGETGIIIDEINILLKQTSRFISGTISSFGAGIKTALSVLTQGITKKEIEK